MTPSSPPLPPDQIAARLRRHFGADLETQTKVFALRREHAAERQELRESTTELRRWREGLGK